jgi:hypothetical protein
MLKGQLAVHIEIILTADKLQYNKELSEVGILLAGSFTRWVEEIKAILPKKAITTKHENHAVLKLLFAEMIQDGVEKCKEFLQNLRTILLPVLSSINNIPTYDKDPKIYLEACQDYLQSTTRLSNICISRLKKNHSRGVFTVRCQQLASHLQNKIIESKRELMESMLQTLAIKVMLRLIIDVSTCQWNGKLFYCTNPSHKSRF